MHPNALGHPSSILESNRWPDALTVVKSLDLPANLVQQAILFAGSAQRIDGGIIGWLPWESYTVGHARGHLHILARDADLLGFALVNTNQQRECRCYQVWVRADARLIEHGRALLDHVEQHTAKPANCWCMRAWVAHDLAANYFWRAIGFTYYGWRHGSERKGRRHLLWRRPVKRENALGLLGETTLMGNIDGTQQLSQVDLHQNGVAQRHLQIGSSSFAGVDCYADFL